MFVPPPQIHMLKPCSQCNGIWRWRLWEKSGQEGGAHINGISVPLKVARELVLFPPREDTARREPGANQEEGTHQEPIHASPLISNF